MTLPPADTPLYNHPLPDIEQWLVSKGCQQDSAELHRWHLQRTEWEADLALDVDSIVIRYLEAGLDGQDLQRIFKYSLSRKDLEEAIFSGP
ncbi:MAG: DUF3143 domain-containing protein [Leptolyngbyaceae cyanobacterium SM1_1_3]|nr:DUF3143 domain-containing protein [Leptolyngbyaceae cyanobacterium SM1_1_3]NJM85154.1 DUF3143 domain-containing protein [Leptolyngbyaceae cyanobacterium RM2_2_21]NJN02164.1 DUF3143 domain-containing protein [Leptolyngbyaceae cyanobacterium RM1_1_2]NJO08954.1 DUF3143 domain-containing protein [Leptolyngbyaceae cyanobacterium SL_1_1]